MTVAQEEAGEQARLDRAGNPTAGQPTPIAFQGRELCRQCVENCTACRRERTGARRWTHGGAHLKPCREPGHRDQGL